jgi:hypothetical protein
VCLFILLAAVGETKTTTKLTLPKRALVTHYPLFCVLIAILSFIFLNVRKVISKIDDDTHKHTHTVYLTCSETSAFKLMESSQFTVYNDSHDDDLSGTRF